MSINGIGAGSYFSGNAAEAVAKADDVFLSLVLAVENGNIPDHGENKVALALNELSEHVNKVKALVNSFNDVSKPA